MASGATIMSDRVAGDPAPDARRLDQFFTLPEIAVDCIGRLRPVLDRLGGDWLMIEPAAGDGVFLDRLPHPRLGIDIASRRDDVRRADFLSWSPGDTAGRQVAVIGNPPFGKNASLARAFINHAAGFADVVAFILPRTFEKAVFLNRVAASLHLIHQHRLADPAFAFEGRPYSVPTVFQIWERRSVDRPATLLPTRHPDFRFVAADDADFAFQRVGARAGLISIAGLSKSPQSHYFILATADRPTVLRRLTGIDWTTIKSRTAGNPSIGKAELVAAYAAAAT